MRDLFFSSLAKAKSRKVRVTRLCRKFRVSRSSVYAQSKSRMRSRDEAAIQVIRPLFLKRRGRAGIRTLKMMVQAQYGLNFSRSRIARIKKKYGLITRIRKKNHHRKWIRKQQEHQTHPNHLNREFDCKRADQVYLTDMTELHYGKNLKAYLTVFKDLATREIVSSQLSRSMDVAPVTEALKIAIKRLCPEQRRSLMVHSDQGFQFTHSSFRKILEENQIKQSMSRKGNCLDNAPVESFFGHLKDQLDLESCNEFEEVKRHVNQEIRYYNHQRPQWNLKKMPPKIFRRHLNSLGSGLY